MISAILMPVCWWIWEWGVAPLEIAERLGHEKVETTLNTYSHLYPSTQSKLAGLLDKKHEEEEE